MVTDPIADMLIRIKNAGNVGKETTTVPYSNLKMSIANLLLKEGYIKFANKKGKKVTKYIEVGILYNEDKTPRVTDVARISKSSRRVYRSVKEIRPVLNGFGLAVLSTPKGLLTDKEAKANHVGGEALFKIW